MKIAHRKRQAQPKTAAILGRWKKTGDCIAVFPEDPGDMSPHTRSSYERMGQHAARSPKLLLSVTARAKPKEGRSLVKELRRIGYRLRVMQRQTAKHFEMRMAILRGVS